MQFILLQTYQNWLICFMKAITFHKTLKLVISQLFDLIHLQSYLPFSCDKAHLSVLIKHTSNQIIFFFNFNFFCLLCIYDFIYFRRLGGLGQL